MARVALVAVDLWARRPRNSMLSYRLASALASGHPISSPGENGSVMLANAVLIVAMVVGQPPEDLQWDFRNAEWVKSSAVRRIPTLPDRINDLAFKGAVETFAAEASQQKPPEPFASLIDQLGWDCYTARQIGYERLIGAIRRNLRDARWLFWGMRHSDPEVRLWCNRGLTELSGCWSCDGSGLCHHKRTAPRCDIWMQPGDGQWEECLDCFDSRRLDDMVRWNWEFGCKVCGGAGRFWNRGIAD